MLKFIRQRLLDSKKKSHQSQPVRLMLEEFEPRILPNASTLFGGMPQPGFGNPAQGGGLTSELGGSWQGGNLTGGWGGSSQQGPSSGQTQALTATLTGTAGTGFVIFSANATAGTNNVFGWVSGLTADTKYSVTSGSTILGTITTDANGNGQLSVSNLLPALTAGAAITVLDPSSNTVLSGTLSAPPSSTFAYLSASLTSPSGASGGGGNASFIANTTATTGQNILNVLVSGLTADSTYSVQIGGASIDRIYTDASGNGQLSVSNVPAIVASGSTITVVDSTGASVLSGTFATGTGFSGSNGCSSSSGFSSSTSGTNTSATSTSSTSCSSNAASSARSSSISSPTISLGSTDSPVSSDASTFAVDLLSGNLSGALAALENFEASLFASQNVSLQLQEALLFLNTVFADLA